MHARRAATERTHGPTWPARVPAVWPDGTRVSFAFGCNPQLLGVARGRCHAKGCIFFSNFSPSIGITACVRQPRSKDGTTPTIWVFAEDVYCSFIVVTASHAHSSSDNAAACVRVFSCGATQRCSHCPSSPSVPEHVPERLAGRLAALPCARRVHDAFLLVGGPAVHDRCRRNADPPTYSGAL
jgi:hypothetical protein